VPHPDAVPFPLGVDGEIVDEPPDCRRRWAEADAPERHLDIGAFISRIRVAEAKVLAAKAALHKIDPESTE
jgi:hypothetical protein